MSYVKSNLADKQLHNATGASTKVHRQDLNYILNNWGRTNSRKNTAIPAKDQTFGGYNIAQASLALDKAILEDKLEPVVFKLPLKTTKLLSDATSEI